MFFLEYVPQSFEQPQNFGGPQQNVPYGFNTGGMYTNVPPGPQPQLGNVFGQPIVQDMALQYGQQVRIYHKVTKSCSKVQSYS